jgi:hypothetical protein
MLFFLHIYKRPTARCHLISRSWLPVWNIIFIKTLSTLYCSMTPFTVNLALGMHARGTDKACKIIGRRHWCNGSWSCHAWYSNSCQLPRLLAGDRSCMYESTWAGGGKGGGGLRSAHGGFVLQCNQCNSQPKWRRSGPEFPRFITCSRPAGLGFRSPSCSVVPLQSRNSYTDVRHQYRNRCTTPYAAQSIPSISESSASNRTLRRRTNQTETVVMARVA